MWVRRACGEGMHQAALVARSACRLEAWMPTETPAMRSVQAPNRACIKPRGCYCSSPRTVNGAVQSSCEAPSMVSRHS